MELDFLGQISEAFGEDTALLFVGLLFCSLLRFQLEKFLLRLFGGAIGDGGSRGGLHFRRRRRTFPRWSGSLLLFAVATVLDLGDDVGG